jgi:hypothetical protein
MNNWNAIKYLITSSYLELPPLEPSRKSSQSSLGWEHLSLSSLSLSLMRVSLSRQKHLCICLLYFRREGLFMANFVITLWFLWLNQRRGHCYFDLRNKIVHVSYLILCLLLFTELGLRLEGAFLFWLWWGLP